jgi:hypothetical protein
MTNKQTIPPVPHDTDTTTHLKYPLPNLNHTLQTDVKRIKQSFEQIDEHVHALQTETQQLKIPLGSLHQFIVGKAPRGFLRCDGGKYPIKTYSALATWLGSFTTEPRAEQATDVDVAAIHSSIIMGTLPAPITQAWTVTVHKDYLYCGLAVSSSGTVAWTDRTQVTFRTAAGQVTKVLGHDSNPNISDVSYQAALGRFAVSFKNRTMIEYYDGQGQYLGYTAKDNPANPDAIALAADGTTYVNHDDAQYYVYQGMQTNYLLKGTFPEKSLALMVNEHGLFVLTATGLYRYDGYQAEQTALNQAKALTHGLTDVRDMALIGDELWVITKTGQVVRYDFDLQKKTAQSFSLSDDVMSLAYHPVEQAVYVVTRTGAVYSIPKATDFFVPNIHSSVITGTLPLPLTLPAPVTQAWTVTVHKAYLYCGLAVSSSGTVAWTDNTHVTFRTAAGQVTQVKGHNKNDRISDISYQADLDQFVVSFTRGVMVEYFDGQGQYLGYTAKDNPSHPYAIASDADGTTYVNHSDSDAGYYVYQGMQTNYLLKGTFPETSLALMVNEHGLFVLTATGLYRYDGYQVGQTALNQAKALTHGLTDVRDMALVEDELWVITKTGQVVRYNFDLQKKTEQTFSLSGDVMSLAYHPVEQAVYAVTSTGAVCSIPVGTLKSLSLSLAYYIKSE